jgi:hypothetical protein
MNKSGQSLSIKKHFFIFATLNCSFDIARMAELVDALVSNTSEVKLVPVRSRLRVLQTPCSLKITGGLLFTPILPENRT